MDQIGNTCHLKSSERKLSCLSFGPSNNLSDERPLSLLLNATILICMAGRGGGSLFYTSHNCIHVIIYFSKVTFQVFYNDSK